jgi:transcriptional regulator with XRE-family HTH domain
LQRDAASATYARQLGQRLREVRTSRHLSLHAVASSSGQEFKPSSLGAYERGERTISMLRLQQLARLYRVPVDRLLPFEDEQAVVDLRDQVDIDEEGADGAEGRLIQSYLEGIFRQRHDEAGSRHVRHADVLVLAALLGCSPELVESQLR